MLFCGAANTIWQSLFTNTALRLSKIIGFGFTFKSFQAAVLQHFSSDTLVPRLWVVTFTLA
jgi:hypothetical protein